MSKTYLYRVKDGEIESQIFETDQMPKRGWYDSPQKAEDNAKRKRSTNKDA